jgi:hypothetical protein
MSQTNLYVTVKPSQDYIYFAISDFKLTKTQKIKFVYKILLEMFKDKNTIKYFIVSYGLLREISKNAIKSLEALEKAKQTNNEESLEFLTPIINRINRTTITHHEQAQLKRQIPSGPSGT